MHALAVHTHAAAKALHKSSHGLFDLCMSDAWSSLDRTLHGQQVDPTRLAAHGRSPRCEILLLFTPEACPIGDLEKGRASADVARGRLSIRLKVEGGFVSDPSDRKRHTFSNDFIQTACYCHRPLFLPSDCISCDEVDPLSHR